MKRNLLTQMKNERVENFWLLLELLIVFLAVWAMCYFCATEFRVYRQPMGFDADNVYSLSLYINQEGQDQENLYSEEAVARRGADMVSLIERLRRNPHVEAAAFSANALPFTQTSMNNQLKLFENDTLEYVANFREASPDIVRIFRYKSTNGVSTEQMEELMRRGELLLGYQKIFTKKGGLERFLGRTLKAGSYYGMDDYKDYISHTFIENPKRFEFDRYNIGTVIKPISDGKVAAGEISNIWEIIVRVKPGEKRAFLDDFNNNRDLQMAGDVYLDVPVAMEDMRDIANREDMIYVRLMLGGTLFLMVIIFLGLVGTFWYRVRQREGEIAVRKVCGATSGDIFRRLISEGLILGTLAALFGVAAGIFYAYKTTKTFDGWKTDFIIGGVSAYILLAIVVIIAVSIPARQAMKVNPANALKNE